MSIINLIQAKIKRKFSLIQHRNFEFITQNIKFQKRIGTELIFWLIVI